MADNGHEIIMDKEIQTLLDRYERHELGNRSEDSGLSSVSRVAGRDTATSIIARVDTKDVFKSDRQFELLVDLSNRANFRSRKERLLFLEWVQYCDKYGVSYRHLILYLTTSRSENAESMQELIAALTRVETLSTYMNKKPKQSPEDNNNLV